MDALEETVRRFVSKGASVSENRVSMTTRLGTDLGMDSLDLIDLVMALEQHFEIMVDDEEIHAINSVQEIVDLVRART